MRIIVFLITGTLVVYGIYAYYDRPKFQLTDTISLTENTLTISDNDSPAYFTYQLGNELQRVDGAIFQFQYGQGSVEELGRVMIISYLDGAAFETFKTQYGGDISRCPASFLNTHTQVLHIFTNSAEELEVLQAGIDKIVPGQTSVDFSFSGRHMSFMEAQAKNGRALEPDFGGQPLFFVDTINYIE